MDVDTIKPGVDFVHAIETSVGSCDVLVAVIGKRWLTASDEEGKRRLDDPEDLVRLEIATALKRRIQVIPVLVDGASMPQSSDLPENLNALVRRSALEVSNSRFKADAERLMGALELAHRPPNPVVQWKRWAGLSTGVVAIAGTAIFLYHGGRPSVPQPSPTPILPATPVSLAGGAGTTIDPSLSSIFAGSGKTQFTIRHSDVRKTVLVDCPNC
jgi:hypothetical protein